MKLGYFFILLIVCAYSVNGDYYSAVTSLHDLLHAESYLITAFEKFMLSEHMKHLYMEDFLKLVEDNVKEAAGNEVAYYGNPVSAFKTVKRITKDWRDLFQFNMKTQNEQELVENLKQLETDDDFKWPLKDDLIGAAKGVARLQHIYKLPTTEFANGTIWGRKLSPGMLSSDCYNMGYGLVEAKDYKQAVTWLLEARRRLNHEINTHTTIFPIINDDWILEQLAPAAINSDNQKLAYFLTREQLMRNPNHAVAKENWAKIYYKMYDDRKATPKNGVTGIAAENVRRNFKLKLNFNDNEGADVPENMTSDEEEDIIDDDEDGDDDEDDDDIFLQPDGNLTNLIKVSDNKPMTLTELYEGACNGDVKPTPSSQRKLRCRYVHNNVPFNLIGPFKREELSLDPFVAVHYNVIYDSEIRNIIEFTENRLERSKVGLETKSSSVSDIRTSQQTWIHHTEPFIMKVIQRLRDLTGLTLETAEALQVANYGIGGHYAPHFDFGEGNFDFRGFGNRILTALFYINDVDMGGATAFPFLNLAVPPTKHSMVMWYNMHESLDVDYRTKHAACPVLKGSKWICNEWFHERGQELLRPCSLTSQADKSIKYKSLN